MSELKLYAFDKLRKLIDEIAPSIEQTINKYLIVKGENLSENIRSSEVEVGANGIYIKKNGIKFRRYIYMKSYKVAHYGLPAAHIISCSKVEEIKRKNYYHYYLLGSADKVDIIDRDTSITHKNKVLRICSYCQGEILQSENIRNTQDFLESLEQPEDIEPKNQETDIFGYTFNWESISKAYRQQQNYTCENCKIQMSDDMDKRFMHTHHQNGNKTWNNPENLECLCVLCHSIVDQAHEANFAKPRMQFQVESFVKKYRYEIIRLGNRRYLEDFEQNKEI